MQSGYNLQGSFGHSAEVLSTCQFLTIPLQEMLVFLDKEREHMEQGYFPEVQDSYILSCRIDYDADFCKALMGTQLKSTEFLKIEQTQLANVIAEEPGNEYYRLVTPCTLNREWRGVLKIDLLYIFHTRFLGQIYEVK